jgi:type VI secretion system secreted protein Hcp
MALGQDLYFAKYEGVGGESDDVNHINWIDIKTFEWSVMPTDMSAGSMRDRALVKVEDIVLSFAYEKSAPKLVEASLRGKVFPKLEIEVVGTFGGSRATYLRYELTNVRIAAYSVSGEADSQGRPVVFAANSFEGIKITYSEYDDFGTHLGNVEMEWKIED